MVYSTLYDKGSLILNGYQYKMLVRYQAAQNQYEIVISRFAMQTNSLDTNWGSGVPGGLPAESNGIFRMTISVNSTIGFNEELLTSGLWKDSDNNLVFGGLVMLSDVNYHGYFLAKLSTSTGRLYESWGTDNKGIVINRILGKNLKSMVAELLVQDDNGIITAGTIDDNSQLKMVTMKHLASGNQNVNFGENGYKIYTPIYDNLNTGLVCKALSFDTYGNYFIAGNSSNGVSIVVSLNSIGNVNNNFSSDGEHVLPSPDNEISTISAMLSAPSEGGLYILANYTHSQTNVESSAVWRIKYNNGDVDTSFNDDGKVELVIANKSDVVATTMRLDRELSLFIGGFCRDQQSNIDSFFLKMNENGIYDETFGVDGVFIDDNSNVEESGGYLYVDYDSNDIKYSVVYRNDQNPDSEVVLLLGTIPYSGDVNTLLSYDHIDKQLISSEQIARVLQAMNLSNSTIITFPVDQINSLFVNTYDSNTGDFTTDSIVLQLSDENNNNNDLINLINSGLVNNFWNNFIVKVENNIANNSKDKWDERLNGVNGFTNDKLREVLRASSGSIVINNINDVLDEYVANDSLFTHRMNNPKHEGFVAGDRLGCNNGLNFTMRVNIAAADVLGGSTENLLLTETKSFNLIINLV